MDCTIYTLTIPSQILQRYTSTVREASPPTPQNHDTIQDADFSEQVIAPDIYTAVLSNATISGHDTAASLAEEFDTVTIGRRVSDLCSLTSIVTNKICFSQIYGECDTPCARTARVIHYIPDPNMSCVYSDMRNHVNYQRENISNEEMNVISKAKNHFHVLAAHENGAKVIIDQWVCAFPF